MKVNAQAQAFQQAHAAAVEPAYHQMHLGVADAPQQRRRFLARQHRWETGWLLGAGNVTQPGQLAAEYLAIEEQQSAQCLVLRGRTDIANHREESQKRSASSLPIASGWRLP